METMLLWLVFLPLVGALLCFVLAESLSKRIAFITSLLGLVGAGCLYFKFDAVHALEPQLGFSIPWISAYGIRLSLAVDGLSFPLVLLTKFMMPIALIAGRNETRRPRTFMFCFLLLDCAMTGTFLATDIFLFYVFWEMMLIPMILIIGIWGSTERIFASLKFFIVTFAGSVLMLVALFWLYTAHHEQFGTYSTEIRSFYRLNFSPDPWFMGLNSAELIFLAFTLAFAIKVPLFPFHTWLPDAHVQAPTGGSILLAAVLLKMGTYGLLRFAIPIAPQAFLRFSPILVALCLIGIFYGAWTAVNQSDMKKLVAYSSVSHLAFVVLGICAINSEGLTGAVLQMVNHGLSTGALFFLVGVLYERRHTRNFADYGGIAEVMPWYAFFLVFAAFSSMAVPGLNGFVGEFLILAGTFRADSLWGSIAVLGVVFGAIYLLLMLRQILFGPNLSAENRTLKDLDKKELAALIPLCALIVLLGIYPRCLLSKIETGLDNYWLSNHPAPSALTKKGEPKGRHHT